MKRCLVSFAVASAAVLSYASTASAFTVTTTSDATSGACSLRVALAEVAANTVGGDCSRASGDNTITLGIGTYTLTSGTELHITSGPTPTIVGVSPSDPTQTVIDAAGTLAIPRRVLEIDSGHSATLQNLEVKGGLSASGVIGASPGQSGTPGANGGGILNNGSLTLDHVLVTDNFTGSGGRGANSAGDGGNSGAGNRGGAGGGVYNGNNASLSITASTITGNGTGDGGDGGDAGPGVNCPGHFPDGATGGAGAYSGSGGGIYNLGGATITTSTVSQNFTGVGGVGGNGGNGAGPTTCPGQGSTVFTGGTGGVGGRGGNGSWGVDPNLGANFQYLTREGGGGIASFGTLTVTASTISGNNTGAGGLGGGSGNPGQQAGSSSFRSAGPGGDGGSAGIGGGLLVDGDINHGQATLTNVTIEGNFTGDGGTGGAGYSGASGLGGGRGGYGGYGGGIWSIGANNLGPVALTHATISQNGLGDGGATGANSGTPRPGIRGQGAGVATGGRFAGIGPQGVTFKNTLVAGNGNPAFDLNCIQYYTNTYNDLGDLGHNLSFPDSSCPGINGDPLLGTLGPNGGPTDTMLPASGSAAIGVVPAASCSATDQRGNARLPLGDTVCDIGAVETGLAAPQSQLSVLKSGTGAGTVTSSPTGINCGATCAANYTTGQLVTLTATPATGSTFSGWSGGGCGGTGQCAVTLNADTQVTATFTPNSTSPGGGGGGPPAAPAGPTGQRAAALKKCKKKKGKARANCLKKAKKLPV